MGVARFHASVPGRMNKGCLIGFGLIWTALSSIFVLAGMGMAWKSAGRDSWERVPCVIERFEIGAERLREPPFIPEVRFRYDHAGESRIGTRLWPEKEGSDRYAEIAGIRETLAFGPEGPLASLEGVAAECRVNAADPDEAALIVESSDVWFGLFFALFGLLFVLIGAGIVWSGFRGRGRRHLETLSKKAAENDGRGVQIVFFLIFAGAGFAILFGFVLPKAAEWLDMRQWHETPATVIWSDVREVEGDDGTSYKVDLFYRYEFAGREHRANRYDLLEGSSSDREDSREIARAHPAGSALTIHVDPENPWCAVVKREVGLWALLALFPLPFIAVGIGGLWWMLKGRRRTFSAELPGQGLRTPLRESAAAPRILRSRGKRGCAFAGALCVALFWNGIVSVFAFQIIDAWRQGDAQWFIAIFLIPFLLVGLVLAALAVYCFFAIFAPVFDIELENADLFPGAVTRLHWRRGGGIGQPRNFILYLVGREEATYRRGTSTSTATSVFFEEVIFESTHPHDMRAGGAELRIPAGAVPSFKGEHNSIRWQLRIRADVPRMPDVGDDHDLTLRLPQRGELS